MFDQYPSILEAVLSQTPEYTGTMKVSFPQDFLLIISLLSLERTNVIIKILVYILDVL